MALFERGSCGWLVTTFLFVLVVGSVTWSSNGQSQYFTSLQVNISGLPPPSYPTYQFPITFNLCSITWRYYAGPSKYNFSQQES
jgi:hypothetical protein